MPLHVSAATELLKFVCSYSSSNTKLAATVQMTEITIRRHVYRAGGGAPPYRSGCLVSTEEVKMNPSLPINGQGDLLMGQTSDHERSTYLVSDLNMVSDLAIWNRLWQRLAQDETSWEALQDGFCRF